MAAAAEGHASIVTALVAAGANLEARDNVVRGVGYVCRGVPLPVFPRSHACWRPPLTSPLACLQANKTALDWAQSQGKAEVVALLRAAAAAAAGRR